MDEDIAAGASYLMSLGDFSKVWFKVVLAEPLLYGFRFVVSNMFICCGEDLRFYLFFPKDLAKGVS